MTSKRLVWLCAALAWNPIAARAASIETHLELSALPPASAAAAPRRALTDSPYVSIECHESERFFVVAGELRDGPGSDLLVKRKTGAESLPCAYDIQPGDFEIKNATAEYFLDLRDNLLFVDSDTGPDPRPLTIYDLEQRTVVFSALVSQPLEYQANRLAYWRPQASAAGAPPCPPPSAGASAGTPEEHAFLDLSTFAVSTADETRCPPAP